MGAGRPDRSFPKAYRLASSEDFRRVYRCAWRGRVGPFAWFARNNSYTYPRLGLAVPKRVLKRATDRSRVKRLIRESFRFHREALPAVDIVVSVKAPPRDQSNPVFGEVVDRVWQDILANIDKTP